MPDVRLNGYLMGWALALPCTLLVVMALSLSSSVVWPFTPCRCRRFEKRGEHLPATTKSFVFPSAADLPTSVRPCLAAARPTNIPFHRHVRYSYESSL